MERSGNVKNKTKFLYNEIFVKQLNFSTHFLQNNNFTLDPVRSENVEMKQKVVS